MQSKINNDTRLKWKPTIRMYILSKQVIKECRALMYNTSKSRYVSTRKQDTILNQTTLCNQII